MIRNLLFVTSFFMFFFSSTAFSNSSIDNFSETPAYGDSTVNYVFLKGSFKHLEDMPMNMSIKVYDIKTKNLLEESYLDENGNYSLSFKKGERYFIAFEAPGYFFDASFIAIPRDDTDQRLLQNYKVDKIVNGSVNKKYMFSFHKSSALLTNTSQLFLDLLARFLNTNTDVVFDLSMNKSEDTELNKRRVTTVQQYLSQKGINKSRITLNLINYNIPRNSALVTVLDKIFNKSYN